jgi:hypothetical protein
MMIAGMMTWFVACSSVDTVRGGEQLEGWRREGEIDVYYVKTPARASELAISKGDPAMMKTTCMESAKLQAMDNIIRKMVGETVEAQSGMLDGQATNLAVTSLRSGQIKGVQQKECAPAGEGGSWQNCECVHYVSGPNLKKQVQIEVTKAAGR